MTINNGARDQLIQNPENKKIIRHEDFIAGVSKGLAILDCFANDRYRLNVSMAAEKDRTYTSCCTSSFIDTGISWLFRF